MNKIILLTCFLCVFGCSTHENFPEPLDIEEPPTVANLAVTHPSDLVYTLDWDISAGDTARVDHHNVYILGTFGAPEFLGTTPANTTVVDVSLPFPMSSIIFGVSVVTHENVEGRLVYAAAPD